MAGLWDGLPGHCGTCEIPLSETVGVKGTASLWFCLPSPVTNGPGVEAGAVTILSLPGVGALKSWWYSGYVCLLWEMAEGKPTLAVEIPGIPAGRDRRSFALSPSLPGGPCPGLGHRGLDPRTAGCGPS